MEYDVKKEARKQYFGYFKIWFIVTGVLLVIGLVLLGIRLLSPDGGERANQAASTERVYDYAEVLTDSEETKLREYIAEKEKEIQADIVLVTIKEPVETADVSWETAMMNYADDFYLENNYGYDKIHGNGMLLLDNWYDGQGGSWLATCGNVYEEFGDHEINQVLDAVYYGLDDGAYEAYRDYVETACIMMGAGGGVGISLVFILPISMIAAVVYALIHLHQSPAKDTTQASTYVAGGRPVMKVQRDDFIRKSVVKRRIPKSSSGSGGGGGRGGSHSRSGVSMGGGGRRR